jgi:hypothetical protein
MLVLFGIALLVSQFLPGVHLWRYWPLIIVGFGVKAMFGPRGKQWSIRHLADGLTTVTFGLVLLGQMIGYLDWDVWLNILRLWPLLLVALGLEIIGKGLRSDWVRALGSVVVIGGLAYGALAMTATAGWPPSLLPAAESEPFDFSRPSRSGVELGSAAVDGGVGTLTLKEGEALASARGRSPFEPVFEVEVDGREADVVVGLGSGAWGPTQTNAALDVTLDRDVVWDLDVDAGVTEYDIDLRGLLISALQLDSGVSDGTLTLGASDAGDRDDPIEVRVKVGVSSLRVRVPAGDNARIVIGEGLTGLETEGEWSSTRSGNRRIYESDGFRDGGAYWDVEIQSGVGSITIEYY